MKDRTAAADRVITFTEGLPGFEASRQFVLIAAPDLDPFTMLQSTNPNGPAFVGIDPLRVDPSYDAALPEHDRLRLGAGPADALVWFALVAAQPDGTATVNLRAPVVINPASMRGIQMLAADSPYRLDHPLRAG
jgi:flagellar assembly factor FliW